MPSCGKFEISNNTNNTKEKFEIINGGKSINFHNIVECFFFCGEIIAKGKFLSFGMNNPTLEFSIARLSSRCHGIFLRMNFMLVERTWSVSSIANLLLHNTTNDHHIMMRVRSNSISKWDFESHHQSPWVSMFSAVQFFFSPTWSSLLSN